MMVKEKLGLNARALAGFAWWNATGRRIAQGEKLEKKTPARRKR